MLDGIDAGGRVRRLARRLVFAGTMLAAVGARVGAQQSTAVDSLVRRAQQLARNGDTAAARALTDSLVTATPEGSEARAEVLFLRASLAADVAAAQKDYRTIIAEYQLSPRAADALLRLGQADYVRGDRTAARRQLERLVIEHPGASALADAWYWLGRARTDDGDAAGGCAALDSASALLPPDDVERRNRVTFATQRCRAAAAAAPVAAAPPPAATAAPAGRWSVQVAAYRTRREAEALVSTMKTRGHEARVDSLAASPSFRVRIGAFASRAEADALVARLKTQRIAGFVVEAIRRAP